MPQFRNSADETSRVRVFIDHWEFSRSWQKAHSGFTRRQLTQNDVKNAQIEAQNILWNLLPEIILEHLDEMEYIGGDPKELRNIDVYASKRRTGDQKANNAFNDWLEQTLDLIPGFEVHHFIRKDDKSSANCKECGASLERMQLEKGLKTKMACDILSYAVKDAFDIAVLFVDDAEIAPSVLCVQEVFDKKVVHIGLKGQGQTLRSAAWGHILLNDFMRDLFRPDDFARSAGRRT